MYIIASKHKETGAYSMSDNPRFHSTYQSAKNEARRLAVTEPNKKFVIMKPMRAFEMSVVEESESF